MALTDAKSTESSKEAAENKEAALKLRVTQLEAEAASQADNIRLLEDELRRREDLLFKTPRKHLEALGSETDADSQTLAEQISELAADVLSRNDQLAEKQLSRARSFLEVLRGASWAREATPTGFKLGKFLDDLSVCLEHEAKKALGPSGVNRSAKGRKGNALTQLGEQMQVGGRDAGRSGSSLSSAPALTAPPVPEPDGKSGPSNSSTLNAIGVQDEGSTVKLPTSYRQPLLPPGRSGNTPVDSSGASSSTATLPAQFTGEPLPHASLDGGMPRFESSYPWQSESKLRMPTPNGTASSLGMSATTGTASSLQSTEAALDAGMTPSTSGVLVMPPGGVGASSSMYSPPDRAQPPWAPRSVLEA